MKPKPCPICGRTPRTWEYSVSGKVSCWTEYHCVTCQGRTLAEATDKWNRGDIGFVSCEECRVKELRWEYKGEPCYEAFKVQEPSLRCMYWRRDGRGE